MRRNVYPVNAPNLIRFFSDRFDLKAASDEDVHYLSNAAEEAGDMARALAEHVVGVGCLISTDLAVENTSKSGALQGHQQADLLFHIANQIETIGHLASIASEAAYEELKRAEAKIAVMDAMKHAKKLEVRE